VVEMEMDDAGSSVFKKCTEQIRCHYSIYWRNSSPIQRVQKAEVDEERLFTG
jgi:hypothetical protein